MSSAKRICAAATSEGEKCQAAAVNGSEFCYFHDPSKAAERREAQSLGGRQNRMKTLDPAAPVMKIRDAGDVADLLAETIDQVRKGQIDPHIANCVGYLSSLLNKALEHRDLEDRLAKVEQVLEAQGQVPELLLTGTENGAPKS